MIFGLPDQANNAYDEPSCPYFGWLTSLMKNFIDLFKFSFASQIFRGNSYNIPRINEWAKIRANVVAPVAKIQIRLMKSEQPLLY